MLWKDVKTRKMQRVKTLIRLCSHESLSVEVMNGVFRILSQKNELEPYRNSGSGESHLGVFKFNEAKA
jgi:hypothetical protein